MIGYIKYTKALVWISDEKMISNANKTLFIFGYLNIAKVQIEIAKPFLIALANKSNPLIKEKKKIIKTNLKFTAIFLSLRLQTKKRKVNNATKKRKPWAEIPIDLLVTIKNSNNHSNLRSLLSINLS